MTDENDEPLIGASIRIVGEKNGVTTDIDGNFSIAGAYGKKIQISYIGYLTQEVTADKTKLAIKLVPNSELLDDVVVVGYGTMTRKDVTGSITTVKAEDLNVGAYTDPGQLLQGKVPGLVVV